MQSIDPESEQDDIEETGLPEDRPEETTVLLASKKKAIVDKPREDIKAVLG